MRYPSTTMSDLPFHLTYDLNRRQRLVPHLIIWGPYALMPLALLALVVLLVCASRWWLFAVLPSLWIFRGFWLGFLDVLVCPVRHMDVIVEENGLGFVAGGERWWIFLDGLLHVAKTRSDTWTVYHYNGTVINIAASAIASEQVAFLQDWARRRTDPKVINAVIERGRRIAAIEKSRSWKAWLLTRWKRD